MTDGNDPAVSMADISGNNTPYGSERSYNGLRHVNALAGREGVSVRVFLMADATLCAKTGQTTPNGYYNLERMLRGAVRRTVAVGACGSCMDARGLTEGDLVEGVHRGSMEELTDWTLWADRTLVY